MSEGRVIMELWDAYDSKLNRIDGMTLVRGEEVPDGVFHLVCEIIVRHTDGTYLLMQRDLQKYLGGMWEASAGGSALKGEDPLSCAMRELSEETGIKADKLTEVGRIL
ncbi:MAG: NUDIX domain-containing protein, partial [Lachnospiraceae bacterium]|nr:NUDIX domain-containing protein [Lachnospiraceae bacterium]